MTTSTTSVRRRRFLGGAAVASALCATALTGTAANAADTISEPPHDTLLRTPASRVSLHDPSYRSSRTTSDAMAWPVDGEVTSTFGPRDGRMHRGVDIAAPTGTPIRSAQDGTVTLAGWKGGYGQTLEIDHGDGQVTRLAHQSELLVTEGEHVRRGERIGRVGTSGSSTGPHLHFEIIVEGRVHDPLIVLPAAA